MSNQCLTFVVKLGLAKIRPYMAYITEYCDAHNVVATTKKLEQSRLSTRYQITLEGPQKQVGYLKRRLDEV